MSERIETARQWLAKARNDLLNMDNNLRAEVIPYDTVCFHCQQAAGKFLKAFLAGKKKVLPITPDLFVVLEKVR